MSLKIGYEVLSKEQANFEILKFLLDMEA